MMTSAADPYCPMTMPPTPRIIKDPCMAALMKEKDVMLNPTHLKYKDHHGPTPASFMRAVMAFRVTEEDAHKLKFKARVCPNGSTLQRGVDFDQTNSPTVRRETVLMILDIAATKDWTLR